MEGKKIEQRLTSWTEFFILSTKEGVIKPHVNECASVVCKRGVRVYYCKGDIEI